MDWSGYLDNSRLSDQVYENDYISDWETEQKEDDTTGETYLDLRPISSVSNEIKARIVECKESNKYNITQDLAEAFEVFCEYEYKCNQKGEFIKTREEGNNIWTGRKVIFHNKGIKLDDAITIDYQKNLQNISVTSESAEIYSKLYVKPTESEHMTNGYITIADTDLNPTGEDYILNFDYMYANGSITPYQYQKVKDYEANMHIINFNLRKLSSEINNLIVEKNNLEADLQLAEISISSLQESLTTFESLLEASIKNETLEYTNKKPYIGICVESIDNLYYGIRLSSEGINANTISGFAKFTNDECTLQLFKNGDLIPVPNGIGSNENLPYVLLDDYGFAKQINIPKKLFTEGKNWTEVESTIYLTYAYSPESKYQAACEKIRDQILDIEHKTELLNEQLININITLNGEEAEENSTKGIQQEYDELLKNKEDRIIAFERLMGPALQEGYWSPEVYEDAGEIRQNITGIQPEITKIFDTQPFAGEILPYYYASVDDHVEGKKTYYTGIIIDENLAKKIKGKEKDIVIKMSKGTYTFTQVSEVELDSTYCYIILDGKKYYSDGEVGESTKGTEWVLSIKEGVPTLTVGNNSVGFLTKPSPLANEEDYYNCTSIFQGLGSYLATRSLFPNAGFQYGYVKNKDKIYGAFLFSDYSIPYDKYSSFVIEFEDGSSENIWNSDLFVNWETNEWVYPRIELDYLNINSNSDSFNVRIEGENDSLVKFEDYSILHRETKTYVNLKTTNNNPVYSNIYQPYHLTFQVSRANEMLYLDALQVAKDNSQPKLSYSLSIANRPQELRKITLGQLIFINDYSIDVHRAPGYVSGITLALDSPKEDEITIANYKTKFEDLFSTITASSEAMKNNKRSYDLASSAFIGGQLSGTVLQEALANNNIALSFSKTNVNMTNGDGIVLTNTTPYTNGVYGQVVLRGGGIFCSSSLDEAGNRIWNSAITPRGINANYITSGQIDTNLIRIYSGNNMAFQWNEEGIYAYKRDSDGIADLSTYVRYSDEGLQFQQGSLTVVDLGWNGLNISTQEGALELNGARGLTMYNGNGNVVLHLGRIGNEPNALYGLTLYDGSSKDIETAPKTFYSTNEGNLWLKKNLFVGVDGVEGSCSGISGVVTEENDIRIWAGAINNADPQSAPFRVYEDGSFYAAKGEISGLIIEGLDVYSTELASGDGFSINSANATSTVYLKFYLGGKQSEVPEGVKYTWYKTKLAYTFQPDDPLKDLSIWEVLDTSTENLCVLNNIQENYWYCGVVSNGLIDKNGNSYKTASTPVKFAIVNDGKSASAVAIESSAAIIQRTLTSGTSPTQIEFRVRKGANYLPLEYGNNFTLFNNYLI